MNFSLHVSIIAIALSASISAPSYANSSAAASDSFRVTAPQRAPLPAELSAKDKALYGAIFAAIDNKNWAEAQRLIQSAPKGALTAMATAELYLAPNSPRAEADQLRALVESAPYLPQAEQLERLAEKRGAAVMASRPGIQNFSYRGSAPKRDLPDSDSSVGALRSRVQQFIKDNDPVSAEQEV